MNRFIRGFFYALAMAFSVHSSPTQNAAKGAAAMDQLAQQALEEAEAGHAAPALRDFRSVLAARPEWQEGRWNLGMLEYQNGEFESAVGDFNRVVGFAPQMGAAWAVLGLSQFELHHYDEALKDLEKAHALGVKEDEEIARVADYHLALSLTRAGQFHASQELLQSEFSAGQPSAQIKIALGLAGLHAPLVPAELDPTREALVQAVGDALLDREHGGERLSELGREHPEIPTLQAQKKSTAANEAAVMRRLFALNTTSIADTDWNQARQDYAAGRDAAAAEDLKLWLAKHPEDGTAWAMLGLCEYRQQDDSSALIHLDRGASLGLKATEEEIREARYTYSILLIHAGKFEQATDVLFTLSEHRNELSEKVEFALGLSLLRRAQFPDAVRAEDRNLVRAAGSIAAKLGASDYDHAFPLFDALLAAHPHVPWLHYAYGTALIALSEFDKAEAEMKAEAGISTQSELPLVRLASIALRRKDAASAIEWAHKALQVNAQSADGHYLLGRALLESGDSNGSIHELEAAERLSPASPEIHFNLAKAYLRAKRPEDAERERKLFSDLSESASKQN